MTIEEQVEVVLGAIAGGRVFADFAPPATPTPYLVYRTVGGQPLNFAGAELPATTNAHVQVEAWAATRLEVSTTAAAVEAAIRQARHLQPEVLTGRVSLVEKDTGLRGSTQNFSLWY